MNWQPIETAPRGKLVLGYDARRQYVGVVFKNHQGEWEAVDFAKHPTGTGFYPTHWAPYSPPVPQLNPSRSPRND